MHYMTVVSLEKSDEPNKSLVFNAKNKTFIWEYLITLKAVSRYHVINAYDDSTPLSSLRWDTEQQGRAVIHYVLDGVHSMVQEG